MEEHVGWMRRAELDIDEARQVYDQHLAELRELVAGAETPRLRGYVLDNIRYQYRLSRGDAQRRTAELLDEVGEHGEHQAQT